MNTQVAGLTLIVAQETDQTGRQITTMIVVLLAIAVLLGLLTAWYWRHTDPRQRAMLQAEARRASREAEEDRRLEVGEPAIEARAPQHVAAHTAPQPQTDSIWADEPATAPMPAPAENDGMSADEWLRLTGPKKQNGARPSGRPATDQAGQPGQAGAQQPAPRHEREA